MNGKTIQIKTVEKLIIQELYNSESSDHRVHTAFARVLDHFSDEDYLHKIGHQRIITTIYINHFYKYKKTKALNQELYIDTKTLLNYRKSYVRLFAKYYLQSRRRTRGHAAPSARRTPQKNCQLEKGTL